MPHHSSATTDYEILDRRTETLGGVLRRPTEDGRENASGAVGSRRKLMAPSMFRDLGLRRARLRRRWEDETAFLLSDPANAKWIMDSIAELDYWREISGTLPFDPGYASGKRP